MDRIYVESFRIDANHGCIDASTRPVNEIHGLHQRRLLPRECDNLPHRCDPWIASMPSFMAWTRTMVRIDA